VNVGGGCFHWSLWRLSFISFLPKEEGVDVKLASSPLACSVRRFYLGSSLSFEGLCKSVLWLLLCLYYSGDYCRLFSHAKMLNGA